MQRRCVIAMRNKQYELSKSKKTLDRMKNNGKKMVIWSLKPDQVAFLSRFYTVEPYLYMCKTRRFHNISAIRNHLLKDLHYSHKHREFLTRPLTEEDKLVLTRNGVFYRVVKYMIVLN